MKTSIFLSALVAATAWTACSSDMNNLVLSQIDSKDLGKTMGFAVLPAPATSREEAAGLPVVVLLHGMGDDHTSLDRFGLSDDLLEGMRTGRLPKAHFVMPNGERGFYFNWHDGSRPYEDYILDEVLPAAVSQLRIAPTRNQMHIMGVSMGGTGAINIGLRHPERFASITSFSGVVFDRQQAETMRRKWFIRMLFDVDAAFGDGNDKAFSDAYNPYLLVGHRPADLPQRIYLTYGTKERERYDPTTGKFHEYLAAQGVDHRFYVYEGGHGWTQWAPHFADALNYALR